MTAPRWIWAAAALPAAVALSVDAAPAEQLFFDDFHYERIEALRDFGWNLRSEPGHPGVPGARWSPDALQLHREGQTQMLRLTAQTDGTPRGTVQAQLCHARKVLHGTYAARVRFANAPLEGSDGDPVIQAVYAVAPLRHDFDPEFSEIDWEYLANGGWGSPETRLYAITWQTVRIEPWQPHHQVHQEKRALEGWHTLVVQVDEQGTRWFVDGRAVARHGGRNRPVVPMAISFSLWFSPGGLLPPSAQPRLWAKDIDWVLHIANRVLAPSQIEARVQRLRRAGTTRHDSVPTATPPLASPCNF